MKRLTKAIMTQYNSSPAGDALRAICNGLYPVQAAQNKATPYMTYEIISSFVDWTMDSELDNPLIQFSVWDDNPAPDDAMDVAKAFKDLFVDALLTVTDFWMIRADKVSERLLRDPDEGWQYMIEMRYLIQTSA